MSLYVRDHKEGVTIAVRVAPSASKNAIARGGEDSLVVRLTAPPVEGRANKELLRLLAKKLGVSPSSLTIIRGISSRDKVILVTGKTSGEVLEILNRAG
jgi:uncharacterized protein (TIGR00251 family)